MTASQYFPYILCRNRGNLNEMRKRIATFIRVMHERMEILRANHFEGNKNGRYSRRTIIATNKENCRVIKAMPMQQARHCVRGICTYQRCRRRRRLKSLSRAIIYLKKGSSSAKHAACSFISFLNNEKRLRKSNSVRFRRTTLIKSQ